LGTKLSTAAPPFIITFTICSSDFVFFAPLAPSPFTPSFLPSTVVAVLLGSYAGVATFLAGRSFFPLDFAGVTLGGVAGFG